MLNCCNCCNMGDWYKGSVADIGSIEPQGLGGSWPENLLTVVVVLHKMDKVEGEPG